MRRSRGQTELAKLYRLLAVKIFLKRSLIAWLAFGADGRNRLFIHPRRRGYERVKEI